MTTPNAGRRYIESEQYKRFRQHRSRAALREPVEVLDAEETRSQLHLRTYSDLGMFDIDGVPEPGYQPSAAPLTAFVETVPVENLQVELGSETAEAELATAVPDGTPYPEGSLSFTGAPGAELQKLPRFGVAQPVTVGLLDEPGRVQSIINRRLQLGVTLGLENDIILGNNVWTGVLARATNTVAKSGGQYRVDALAAGVAAVGALGWYARPMQIVIHPTTRAAVYGERDTAGRPLAVTDYLDGLVDSWVVTDKIPVGLAVVGDFFDAVALFVKGGLSVAMSTEHLNFFTRGMVEMQIGFRAYAWVREPGALCTVSGIA